MKYRFGFIVLGMLFLNNASSAGTADSNFKATRDYYSRLTARTTPNLAELALFTTMLPKGGDLHHHFSGAIYAETYLDWAAKLNYCIYRTSDAELGIEKFRVEPEPDALSETTRALCISAAQAREDTLFYRELLQKWSNKDYDNHFHEQAAPDQQFFDTFGYFGELTSYDYNQALLELKARAKEENLGYMENMLKSAPASAKPELNDALQSLRPDSSRQQMEEAFGKAFEFLARDTDTQSNILGYAKSLEEAAAGIDDETFKLRFLAYVSRNSTPAKVFSGLYASFAAAARCPLIVGVNIVGPENGYIAMRDYSLHMNMFAFLKQRFPKTRLSLHAGELALGMVPPEGLRNHIREALLVAGAERIGHGVDLPHEADALELLELMRQRKIALEINLTSNAFILGIKNEAHPLPLYNRAGVPLVISSDDPGVSRSNLSGEYLLYVSRYKPSYDSLKTTVYNGIRYSFLAEREKQAELEKLDRRFAEFEARFAHPRNPLANAAVHPIPQHRYNR